MPSTPAASDKHSKKARASENKRMPLDSFHEESCGVVWVPSFGPQIVPFAPLCLAFLAHGHLVNPLFDLPRTYSGLDRTLNIRRRSPTSRCATGLGLRRHLSTRLAAVAIPQAATGRGAILFANHGVNVLGSIEKTDLRKTSSLLSSKVDESAVLRRSSSAAGVLSASNSNDIRRI